MKLRGIEFGAVLDASGARNFDGNGWWYHPLAKPFGMNFEGSTFVAKTTTAFPNAGNMLLKADGMTPQKLFPDCIWVDRAQGIALNAVGLSGPGAEFLLANAGWEKLTQPFFLSFMALPQKQDVTITAAQQAEIFVSELLCHLPNFRAPIGIQLNASCPNVGAQPQPPHEAILNVHAQLDQLARAKVPLMLKVSVTTPVDIVMQMANHYACDAICVSNTVPWGKLPDKIDWKKLFGTDISPLAKYGGGGLSGAPLLPIVESWVREAREQGFSKAINAGGGILCPTDAGQLLMAGADSVFIGSMAFLRPMHVARTIRHATEISRLIGR
ncbi:MAG: hypothetical protein NT003_01940 [Candidatus Magasanikbacteria bacterium]|nr:hypothetical protein [Candidatus Magasanikbacteria bacterium]